MPIFRTFHGLLVLLLVGCQAKVDDTGETPKDSSADPVDSSEPTDSEEPTETGTGADTGESEDSGSTEDSGTDTTPTDDSGAVDTASPVDNDKDGFFDGDDCDDEDSERNPGATEYCDGIDNDCDGLVDLADPDLEAYGFFDYDGDGYGDPDSPATSCAWEEGLVSDGSDCDDSEETTYPGAAEYCDGIDNDCDDAVDEDPAVLPVWYADGDADGYGQDVVKSEGCDAPAGATSEGGDCDDADPLVNPAASETWYDGIDSDCAEDNDYDADVDGDAALAFGGTDCDDAEPLAHADGHEVCGDSIDNDCDGWEPSCAEEVFLADALGKMVGEEEGDGAGLAVAGAGDVNGDGYSDVLIGSGNDAGGAGAGAAYLVYGPLTAERELSEADAKLVGESGTDGIGAGSTLAGAGDVNNDGHDDLLVGAYLDDDGGWNAGAAYVVLGPVAGTASLSDAYAKLLGEGSFDHAGHGLGGGGDVDGDGNADVLVGAYRHEVDGEERGAAYLVLGGVSGETGLADAEATILGAEDYADLGTDVAFAGDTDGDGLSDLLLGAPGRFSDEPGSAYLFLGPVIGEYTSDSADASIEGVEEGDYTGSHVAGAGDVNNDGYDDVLVASSDGASYLVYGPFTGTVSVEAAGARFESPASHTGAIAPAGDVNGDGHADVALSASIDGSATYAGYLALGPISGTLELGWLDYELVGEAEFDEAAGALDGAGDVDGDGLDDLIVGATGHGTSGVAYVVLGSAL